MHVLFSESYKGDSDSLFSKHDLKIKELQSKHSMVLSFQDSHKFLVNKVIIRKFYDAPFASIRETQIKCYKKLIHTYFITILYFHKGYTIYRKSLIFFKFFNFFKFKSTYTSIRISFFH